MKALILAAGFGTRLRPFTNHMAKPALPFFNKPILAHIIEKLFYAGISEVFINLHHCPNSIRDHIHRYVPIDVKLRFNVETKILGTAGALIPFKKHLSRKTFLLVNGDILFDIALDEVIKIHASSKALSTLVLHPPSLHFGFSPIGANMKNEVTMFPYGPLKNGNYDWQGTFTGIHVIEPEIYHYITPTGYSCINSDVYPKALSDRCILHAYRHPGYWNDIGSPSQYIKAHWDGIMGKLEVGQSAMDHIHCRFIDPSIRLGTRCSIGNRVVLSKNVIIEDDASIGDDVIVWPGNRIQSGSHHQRCVVISHDNCVKMEQPYET